MEFPIVSAITAGALLIVQQLPMLKVGMCRTKVKTGVGYSEDPDLERLSRRHGNLAENTGIFVATLALLELLAG